MSQQTKTLHTLLQISLFMHAKSEKKSVLTRSSTLGDHFIFTHYKKATYLTQRRQDSSLRKSILTEKMEGAAYSRIYMTQVFKKKIFEAKINRSIAWSHR